MADEAPTIRVEVVDSVSTVAFARPELRNPLGLRTYRELTAALQRADADDAVRCHVITGDGVAFSSGGELGSGQPHETTWDWYVTHEELGRHLNGIRDLHKPVIGAVNGICFGSGLILAAHCDIVIASDQATFSFIEGRMGLAGVGMMAHLIGPQWAKFLMVTGEIIDAAKAKDIGIVLEVIEHARFADKVAALGQRVAAMPPYGVMLNKRNVNAAMDAAGWLLTKGFNQSHYPVIDSMAPHAVAADGRRLVDIMRDEGWKAWRTARDAPFAEPWLETKG